MKVISTSLPSWGIIDRIELQFVKLIQSLFFIKKTYRFFDKLAFFAGSRSLSFLPLLLFSLGNVDKSIKISNELIVYAFVSSLGKIFIKRKRPQHYGSVFYFETCLTSSFPSRHCIASVIFSDILPTPELKVIFLSIMVIDRIALGYHFLTDCLAGVALGYLCVYAAQFIHDPILILFLLIIGNCIWKPFGRISGGILPILLAPRASICPLAFPLSFMKVPIGKFLVQKWFKKDNAESLFLAETAAYSFVTYILVKGSPYICDFGNQYCASLTHLAFRISQVLRD